MKTFGCSTNPDKFLYIIVPWCNIVVADRPVHPMAITCICFKIQIAQSITLPAPCQRSPSNLVTPDPVKWCFLDVWLFGITYVKMPVGFVCQITPERILFFYLV